MLNQNQTSGSPSAYQHHGGMEHHDTMQACWSCSYECKKTLYTHCLAMGGAHVDPAHVKIMTDCIQICQMSADFMARESEMDTEICKVCAVICDNCAESCAAIGGEEMDHCAETCRSCAQSCRDTAGIEHEGMQETL